jgi:hypothetical protein
MKNKIITSGIMGAILGLCLCASQVSAQDEGGPGGPPPGEFGNGDGPGGAPVGQNRNFDPAQFQQRMLEQVRQNLSITNDEEWSAIQPLVQKVMEAQRDVRAGGMGGPPGGPRGRNAADAQSNSEQQALQKLVDDNAPVQQIQDALSKCRAARRDKQAKLESAQASLKAVLSTSQEAQAVLMGLLP